jgi:hypothetical protein
MIMDPLLRVVIIWIIGFGTISILIKERVSKKLIELGIPLPAGYYLLVTPIILMEEALTIEGPYFWGILPMILAFYSFFLILFIIQRVGRIDNWIMVAISGTLGWINEFLIVGRINQMDGPVLLIMS